VPVIDFGKITIGDWKILDIVLQNDASIPVELQPAEWQDSDMQLLMHGQVVSGVAVDPASTCSVQLQLNASEAGRLCRVLSLIDAKAGVSVRAVVTATAGLHADLKQPEAKLRTFGKARRVLVTPETDDVAEIDLEKNPPNIPFRRQAESQQGWHSPGMPNAPVNVPMKMKETQSIMDGFQDPELCFVDSTCSPLENRPHKRSRCAADLPVLSQHRTMDHMTSLERQQFVLQAWMNVILCSEEDSDDAAAMLSSRRASKIRGRLLSIYKRDESLRKAMLLVEQRLESGHLKTSDTALKGVQERRNLVCALRSYHPLWLRLAAEIAIGRDCSQSHPVDLDAFLKNDFLSDAALLARHKGMRSQEYWSQLGKLVTKRVLLLVALLDRLGSTETRGGVRTHLRPLLLRPGGGKLCSSSSVLQAAVGPLLNETEVERRLGRLGYSVRYAQHPRDEMAWAVVNLAVDLRDGLRLCRVAEEITGHTGIVDAARFPATRRPDRLYNVAIALRALSSSGLSLLDPGGTGAMRALPAVIVDGDREATTRLLWRLVLQCHLLILIDTAQLEMEIDHLRSLDFRGDKPKECRVSCCAISPSLPSEALIAASGRAANHVCVLLKWVQAVTELYRARSPRGFGSDFADGSIFSFLVHHYLGADAIPLSRIFVQNETTTLSEAIDGSLRNYNQVYGAVKALGGGIPHLLTGQDFSSGAEFEGGADERAIVLFTGFLCRRLIETNKEHRAAMIIQRRWRERAVYRPGAAREHLHRWISAARMVQRNVRVWLLRRGMYQFSEDRRNMETAIIKLQALWRSRAERRTYIETRSAAIAIQAAWRGAMTRRAFVDATIISKV